MTATQSTPTAHKLPAGIVGRQTSYNADPARITFREGWNNRFDMGDIDSLAVGIKATTERHPSRPFADSIGVRRIPKTDPRAEKFDFEVEYGHRRTLAAKLLLAQGFTFPEGVNINLIDKDQSELDSKIDMFNENNKEPLKPLEEAVGFKWLRDYRDEAHPKGFSIAEICKVTGRAHMHVQSMLALLEADPELIEAVKRGEVGVAVAKDIAVAGKGDAEAVKELTKIAKEAKGTKGAGKLVKRAIHQQKEKKAEKKGKTLKMRALDDDQLAALGEKVAKILEQKARDCQMQATNAAGVDAMLAWIKQDDKLVAAYTVGALQALKAAAGLKINLDL